MSEWVADSGAGSGAATPVAMLRAGHNLLRQLFVQYAQARDPGEKRDVGSHLLLMMQLHAAVEEGVFYPRVQQIDPRLVGQCAHEHEQVHRIVQQLKPMDEGDPQAEHLFGLLKDAVLRHIEDEEQRLFPQIALAGLDLDAIFVEMQAMEARLAAARTHPPSTRALVQ
ncbi:MAG TPA: hemerythrin domain-containing protein [Noviherbaspirillum sp.]|jgi:hemerythrin superfamily protein|uniref:hemerythrin domain-containing protein n=1 Tax=Noviherbaspirillum sp. TaxID=1926288 RepID=UPI002F92D628